MEVLIGLLFIVICLYTVYRLLEEATPPKERAYNSYTWERPKIVRAEYPKDLAIIEEALDLYLYQLETKERIKARTKEACKNEIDLIFNEEEAIRRFRKRYGIAV